MSYCFLHFLAEHTPKKMLPNNKFKMAAKFKMATKTQFAYVAKKTLVHLKVFGQLDYIDFGPGKKLKKIFENSKIKNGRQN
jgi:hypothetical protein